MKLSVMMITYNHERFIAQAIESALTQRVNFDYEIVIGEDCSTDNTRTTIMDFSRRHPGRIVPFLRRRNIGVTRNFAQTIEACRGQYLAFLEGDDYWTDPDKLQKQIDFLDAHTDRAIVCHRVQRIDETNSAKLDVFPERAAGQYTIEDLLKLNFVMTCSMVMRREFIGRVPTWFFDMKLADWPLCAMVARHGTIELMDDTMAVYRVHPTGVWSSRPYVCQLRESSRMLKALDKYLEFKFTNTIGQTVRRLDLDAALIERQNGNRAGTFRQVLTCLRNGGWKIPQARRTLAGLATYGLVGSWYKIFSKAKSQGDGVD
jgi:glycosyltransferase involved in cell wall biosynthesis